MIGASSLPGHTMIVCHFPVGQLPPWQLPIPAVRSSARRPGRVCSAGLTRAASLPEQDTINREHAFRGGKRNFSSSYGSLTEDRAEEEGTSDSSGRCDSTSSPEEASSHLKKGSSDAGGHLRSHNSFLPSTEHEEDDEDGDNLHRYYEDSSFALHGNSNWLLSNGAMNYTLSHGDLEGDWNNEGTMLGTGGDQHWLSNHPKQMDPVLAECQCFHMRRSDISLTSQDNICGGIQDKCSPERLSNCHTDSSCTSSDGILVNFCAMYNRSNNPATPHDLSSPAVQTSDESVLLSLQAVSHSPTEQAQHKHKRVCSPPTDEVHKSRWSPQGVDSNCNLYPQEPEPPGLSSLEVSDLTACLQSQATIAVETNQKYYKLVTCDLSSQSPSPAWSSLTSCAEGQGHISPFPTPPENFRDHNIEDMKESEDRKKEEKLSPAGFRLKLDCSHLQACDFQVASTSTDRSVCRRSSSDGLQNHSHTPYSQCLSRGNLHGGKCKAPADETTRLSIKHHQMNADGTEKGKCSVGENTENYKKPQRPTSLPIQPFVLLPEGKPQSEVHLGCLLEQYINQKAGKSGKSQHFQKFTEKRSRCLPNHQLSPTENRCSVFLEAPSSSDTCSTCTPSPKCFTNKQANKLPKSNLDSYQVIFKTQGKQVQDNTSKTETNTPMNSASCPSNLVKIPTYQDLIDITSTKSCTGSDPTNSTNYSSSSHTPPTLPLTADPPQPNVQVFLTPPSTSLQHLNFPQHPAAPAAVSSFSHRDFFPTSFPSVASLTSLSSLLSLASSSLHPQQFEELNAGSDQIKQRGSLSERSPSELCFSSDSTYDSMSISHLQRRGLLLSVSSAVDLIMAHFSSSRDPDEKMCLGNSSYSPTISALVLEHLCPAIQNLLNDGLRDHKLDFIIGQRRNHSWNVVEASTRIGPSTRVLHSLVSKIKQCSQLTSHCMRLRAFIMGLLNLRALEFWFSHLQSQKDLLASYYHSWGFLSMTLGRCQPMFQELLLLLQPLSVLPFDLNLLMEPRLFQHRLLCSETRSPPQPCSALLVTSWPKLQTNRTFDSSCKSHQTTIPQQRSQPDVSCQSLRGTSKSLLLDPIPEYWPKESDLEGGVVKTQNIRENLWFQTNKECSKEEKIEEKEAQNASASDKKEDPVQGGRRWSKLFGAANTFGRAESRSFHRRPSQWLQLDAAQLGLLARTIRNLKGGAPTRMEH
ncbi:Iporin [Oryzias melastigma]|uniref:Iporin n=1 Tax=Oryzias melastigma TaxID=30732 RepID=A0A834CC43_ORYME|nr:Iporin [Oryzias melastigma]